MEKEIYDAIKQRPNKKWKMVAGHGISAKRLEKQLAELVKALEDIKTAHSPNCACCNHNFETAHRALKFFTTGIIWVFAFV